MTWELAVQGIAIANKMARGRQDLHQAILEAERTCETCADVETHPALQDGTTSGKLLKKSRAAMRGEIQRYQDFCRHVKGLWPLFRIMKQHHLARRATGFSHGLKEKLMHLMVHILLDDKDARTPRQVFPKQQRPRSHSESTEPESEDDEPEEPGSAISSIAVPKEITSCKKHLREVEQELLMSDSILLDVQIVLLVCTMMSMYATDVEIARDGSSVLASMLTKPCGPSKDVVKVLNDDNSGLRILGTVLSTVELYRHDLKVFSPCLTILVKICKLRHVLCEFLRRNGLATLKLHSFDKECESLGMVLVATIACHQQDQTIIAEVLPFIGSVMKNKPENVKIQQNGCFALSKFCDHSQEVAEMILASGLESTVLSALHHFPNKQIFRCGISLIHKIWALMMERLDKPQVMLTLEKTIGSAAMKALLDPVTFGEILDICWLAANFRYPHDSSSLLPQHIVDLITFNVEQQMRKQAAQGNLECTEKVTLLVEFLRSFLT